MKTYLDNKVKVYSGDSNEVLKELADNSIDSIVTDPPYALVSIVKRFGKEGSAPTKDGDVYSRSSAGFMGKQWDTGETAFAKEFWQECYRVLKPGGYVLSFGATRSYHRLACAIEDAGFEIRDCIMWVYGCFSEDTQCLTKNGWKNYTDIIIEDEILQWDSVTNDLTWANPKQILVYDAPEEMIHLQNRNTDQLVTSNHRVYGKFRKHSRNTKPEEFEVELAGNIKKHWHKDLPLAGALFSGKRENRSYILGWWMTDAWLHSDGKACMFSQSKIKTLDKLRTALSNEHCNFSEYTKPPKKETHGIEHTFYVTGDLADYLISNYKDRTLTWDVLQFDNWSRYELLEGLLDGDGSRRVTQHSETFWSKNPEYLDIVQALCVSLNIRSHIDYKKGCVYLNRKTNTTQLQSKHITERVKYNGSKVWCLETETGAFVVRRNGKAFISGNSGFPKSHDVSKGIDKKFGAQREIIGSRVADDIRGGNLINDESKTHIIDITIPSTPEAKQWSGWGSALKPAWESIVLARKNTNTKDVKELLEKLCQIMYAKTAGSSIALNKVEQKHQNFVLWNAEQLFNIPEDLLDQMDMLQSKKMEYLNWNTVLSWKNIWEEVLMLENTSIIETKLNTIIDWKILKFYLSKIIQDCITKDQQQLENSNASIVMEQLDENFQKLKIILTSFVQENVIKSQHIFCQDEEDDLNLSPNSEPIVMARKPVIGTIADNVLQYGTGAINIDGCRVGNEILPEIKAGQSKIGTFVRHDMVTPERIGRWPANLIHDGSDEVVEAFPTSNGARIGNPNNPKRDGNSTPIWGMSDGRETHDYRDSGSASRFFYNAKASKNEKVGNHPTQKPIALMQYLCRLVTPPGGTVLDPFAGTGTTAEGAWREGFNCILIEREEEYVQFIDERMNTVNDRLEKPKEKTLKKIEVKLKNKLDI